MSMFKVNDKVHLKETSAWFGHGKANPGSTSIIGTVIAVLDRSTSGLNIKVLWENDTKNSYREHDLALVSRKEISVHYKCFKDLTRNEQIELFCAWLDGRKIEVAGDDTWGIPDRPLWLPDAKYRIKPG